MTQTTIEQLWTNHLTAENRPDDKPVTSELSLTGT